MEIDIQEIEDKIRRIDEVTSNCNISIYDLIILRKERDNLKKLLEFKKNELIEDLLNENTIN